jgi:SdrD B-like domain
MGARATGLPFFGPARIEPAPTLDHAPAPVRPGAPGVVLNLYTCEGEFVATTTTDANGAYRFDVPDKVQDYKVCFERGEHGLESKKGARATGLPFFLRETMTYRFAVGCGSSR